jgi:23S rRNA pseudouridine2457 synthase
LLTEQAIKQLQNGVTINVDGKQYTTKKASAEILLDDPQVSERYPPVRFRMNIPTSWLSLTIAEGKNRQVRKMTAAVGFPTLRLIRYAIGNINIEGLAPGDSTLIDEKTLQLLLKKIKKA